MKYNTPKSNLPELGALKQMFESYLDHDVYDIEALASWCQRPSATSLRVEFKQQLRRSIDFPGLLSPQTFEAWTNVSIEDQSEMQERLKTIWNASFPREVIP